MKKTISIIALMTLFLGSCVSNKKYIALEKKHKDTEDLLNTAVVKLNMCMEDKSALNASLVALKDQNDNLKQTNAGLISSSKDMTVLTTKGAENLEKSLESLREKDLKISRLQDALTKKDSVTLALVTSLKSAVGISDPDIEVNVEKGVVFISIADKLLFKSGSYEVSNRAKEVLEKVAKVVNDKPDFECMVEGHTDNLPYNGNRFLLDNWDLSAKRSTAIIRVLTTELKVNPKQLIAAGRAEFVPLVANIDPESRSKNRRTRIVVLPKIDQFYDMIEKEMKKEVK